LAKRAPTIKYPTKYVGLESENTLSTLTIIERSKVEESKTYNPAPDRRLDGKPGKIAPKIEPRIHKTEQPARIEKPKERPKNYTVKPIADNYELPASYNTTSLTLIARDPFWIYAYWEISPSSMDSMRRNLGQEFDNSRYVLRMYDITCVEFNGYNARSSFDLEVGGHANNWYINLWNDCVSYLAEIGLRAPDGRFFAFARSNNVTTPRASSSNRRDEIWMEAKENAAQAPFVIATLKGQESKYGRHGKQALDYKKQIPFETRKGRKIFLTEDDVRAYYSRLMPYMRNLISSRLAKQQEKMDGGRGGAYLYLKGKRVTLNDIVLRGMSRGEFIKRLLLGSSAELVFSGASEGHIGGASEQSMGEKRRKFFFEIWTELIVYGRTEPDARVWLGDKEIKLRSDGTFTLRYALPDGKTPFAFTAESNDKVEKREISTAVERVKTRYNP